MAWIQVKKIPLEANRLVCPSCKVCNNYSLEGKIKGNKQYLYFKCHDCDVISRKTHEVKE